MASRKYEHQNVPEPKIVNIRKSNQGFGFTVRHFIKYPPEGTQQQTPPMETVFIKEVHRNGPAFFAGLQQGDRLLKVNNISIAGLPYSQIVCMIKQTQNVLRLHVVPKECDVLQFYFEDLAHNPESNRTKSFAADVQQNLRLGQNHNQPVHNLYSPPTQSMHSNFLGAMNFPTDESQSAYSKPYLLSPNQPLLLNRLKKSIEQKEEFLRLPPSFQAASSSVGPRGVFPHATDMFSHACDIEIKPSGSIRQSESKQTESNLLLTTGMVPISYKREVPPNAHINNNSIPPPYEPPPVHFKLTTSPLSPTQFPLKDSSVVHHRQQKLSPNVKQGNKSSEYVTQFLRQSNDDNLLRGRYSCDRFKDNSNLNSETIEKRHSDDFNIVSQLAKKFESGAPLSPESQKQALFYKSELSRFNKFSNPIVNIRKKEIEMKTRLENESIVQNSRNDLKVLETPNSFKDIEIKCNFDGVHLNECDQCNASAAPTIVVRRQKPIDVNDKKIPRRISYLRATGNDKEYHSDIPSCPEATTCEEEIIEKDDSLRKSNTVPMIDKIKSIALESEMNVKTSGSADKISHCRSWHACKTQLMDNVLKAYAKHNANLVEIDARDFEVSEDDLSKRKFVFKLTPKANKTINDKHSAPIEIHFETKSIHDFRKWVRSLQEISFMHSSHDEILSKSGSQLAEPQQVSAITSVQTALYEENTHTYETESSVSTENGINQTVAVKSRKSSTTQQHKEFGEKEMGSPKSRTWKHLFRKIQGNSDGHGSYSPPPPIGSIGVPLRMCPMSKDNEYVPYLVDFCTKIVESKGLTVKGIYRIPGNKAAISELRDQVNKKDFDFENSINDPKWEDVNVVSSLLKLFIRSLPDALLPSSFYNSFIEADKKTGERRCKELFSLLQSLPKVSYETVKHIIRHLHRVSQHCGLNLMEPKNLAIIFGPSIIRTPDETLEIAVKDMKYQCRIVELFITQYEYFFESGALPQLAETPPAQMATGTQQDQTNLLLGNVSKIEHKFHDKESISSRFIPHLRRRTHKKSSTNSDTHSGESISSFEAKPITEDKPKDGCEFRPRDDQDSMDGGSTEQTEDDELNMSQISDTGSMSLTTVTDVLETKLRDIRKTPDSPDQRENLSKSALSSYRRNQSKPLSLGDNIPYADESPERNYTFDGVGRVPLRGQYTKSPLSNCNHDTKSPSRTSSSYAHDLQSDDSEVSTTSDPKDTLVISPLVMDRLKKRRDYRLFRSASFNCRNYSSRTAQNQQSALTKDEKTDMNITKKRQIQNKQNRSIKRRHTLGSPNDYFTTITRRTNNDNMIEVGIRIKNVKKRS